MYIKENSYLWLLQVLQNPKSRRTKTYPKPRACNILVAEVLLCLVWVRYWYVRLSVRVKYPNRPKFYKYIEILFDLTLKPPIMKGDMYNVFIPRQVIQAIFLYLY